MLDTYFLFYFSLDLLSNEDQGSNRNSGIAFVEFNSGDVLSHCID